MIRHAGLIARRVRGRWLGALIEGPSGSGKSDLALRALARGWTLVADDRTVVWVSDGRLFGRAPDALAGLIEARGVGILAAPRRGLAEIAILVRCVERAAVERMPDPETQKLLGIALPAVALAALDDSAPAKLDRALAGLDSPANRRITTPAPARGSPDAGGVP